MAFKIMEQFKFICSDKGETVWNTDYSMRSMLLFKFHIIVIFMYTAMVWIILWEIPYRYDRL